MGFNPDQRIGNIQVELFSADVSNMSAWTFSEKIYGTYKFQPPKLPSVAFELGSGVNSGKFNWSIESDDSSPAMFRRYRWESVLVSKWNSSNPPGRWTESGGGYTTSGEVTRTESIAVSNFNASYTRWFRVKAYGPGGESAWVYAHHTYALPREAVNVKAHATRRSGNAGYICEVSWVVPNSFMYPCDSAEVKYAKAVPETTITTVGSKRVTSMSYPGTSSPSWTAANTVIDTSGTDSLTFVVPNLLADDQLLWARVDSKHDNHVTYGIPVLFGGALSQLPTPELTSISVLAATHRATITIKNNSNISASFVAIYFRKESDPDNYQIVGIFEHGTTSDTIILPDFGDDAVTIGLQCFVADYTPATKSLTEETIYTISNIKLRSAILWEEGAIPVPPKNVVLTPIDVNNINVKWDWSWLAATNAELSWADREDAWISTAAPSTYELTDLYNGDWNIAGLDVGTWWVRVRLGRTLAESNNINWSLYSNPVSIKLASAPAIPSLVLSDGASTLDEYITCYWAYVSTDGTAQLQAEVCEAVLTEAVTYELTEDTAVVSSKTYYTRTGTGTEQDPYVYTEVEEPETADISSYYEEIRTIYWVYNDSFAKTQTEQHITFLPRDLGWDVGETHYLAVRVISQSGETSEGWSTPVALTIVEPVTCTITSTSLEDLTFTEPDMKTLTADTAIVEDKTYYTRSGEGTDESPYVYTEVAEPVLADLQTYYEVPTKTVASLTEFPFEVTVSGAGLGSTTSLIVERAGEFHMKRPDDTEADGYEGETIINKTFINDGVFELTIDDAIGHFDDRAPYRLTAVVKDSYGQTAEASIDFEVHWSHKAVVPTAEIDIDEDYSVAMLTPLLPAGATLGEGDVCDIYRLSVDPPQLIYSGAEFGSKYVDRYTALGVHSGYRFVYRTVNGDYTTSNHRIAWYDSTTDPDAEVLDADAAIINFGAEELELPYGTTLSNKWKKSFTKVAYLGGSVQGYWDAAVDRTGNVGAVVIDIDNLDIVTIEKLRKLAVYAGICYIRTPEGSSFACNIDVSENRSAGSLKQIASVTLDITRVDYQGSECMTYERWLEYLEMYEDDE